jgi:hypothetical protein
MTSKVRRIIDSVRNCSEGNGLTEQGTYRKEFMLGLKVR